MTPFEKINKMKHLPIIQQTLVIDGRLVPFKDGDTIAAAAKREGFDIPTLCHLDGLPPSSSCMVCVVVDKQSGRAIPSCATPARAGMELESDTDAVRSLRKGALEMLLCEHLGDCEGLCSLACPSSIDIPAALRGIRGGDNVAVARALSPFTFESFPCLDCTAPCEKACRRGRHDAPVAIRNVLLKVREVLRGASIAGTVEAGRKPSNGKKFRSKFGSLEANDMEVFLDAASKAPRNEPGNGKGFSDKEVVAEVARCLDCDCAAAGECALRVLADKLGADSAAFKERRGEHGRGRDFARIRGKKTILEPGKCVLCGRCVETTKERESGLVFLGRGYRRVVSPPFGVSLDDALGDLASLCVERCPTGALAWIRCS